MERLEKKLQRLASNKSLQKRVVSLYDRYQSESEYEDWRDYQVAVQESAKASLKGFEYKNFKVIKKPFGFRFEVQAGEETIKVFYTVKSTKNGLLIQLTTQGVQPKVEKPKRVKKEKQTKETKPEPVKQETPSEKEVRVKVEELGSGNFFSFRKNGIPYKFLREEGGEAVIEESNGSTFKSPVLNWRVYPQTGFRA